MAGSQRLLAIAIAFSISGIPSGARPTALAIILQANHARLRDQAASEGTTIFDGDRLSTDAGGSLKAQIADATVLLNEASSVIVHNDAKGLTSEFEVELASGTVALSETPRMQGEIVASGARVRPAAEKRGVVKVQIVSARELVVFAQAGPAAISYRGESETIPEGKSYRVLLNTSDGGAGPDDPDPKRPGKRGKALVIVAVAGATAGMIILTTRGKPGSLESPDRP